MAQSRILLKVLRKQGNEETISTEYYLINISLLSLMVVDVTELFTLGKPTKSAQAIVVRVQENLTEWPYMVIIG